MKKPIKLSRKKKSLLRQELLREYRLGVLAGFDLDYDLLSQRHIDERIAWLKANAIGLPEMPAKIAQSLLVRTYRDGVRVGRGYARVSKGLGKWLVSDILRKLTT